MAFSELTEPGLGLLTTFHAVPFQCSISVFVFAPTKYWPTAHTSRDDTAVTASSWLSPVPTLRLAVVTQVVHVLAAAVLGPAVPAAASTAGGGVKTDKAMIAAENRPSWRGNGPPSDRHVRMLAPGQETTISRRSSHAEPTGAERSLKVTLAGCAARA